LLAFALQTRKQAKASVTAVRKLRRSLTAGGSERKLSAPRRGAPVQTAATAQQARKARGKKMNLPEGRGKKRMRKRKQKNTKRSKSGRKRKKKAEQEKKKQREREKKKAAEKKKSERRKKKKAQSSSSETPSSSSEPSDSSQASGEDSGSSSSDPDSVSTWTMLKPLFAMADRPDYMRCKRKVSVLDKLRRTGGFY
jgi:hypothetical protein